MHRITRDLVLFAAGLLGVIHETVVQEEVRAELLMIFAAMLGLPLFLRSDESRHEPPVERRSRKRPEKVTLEELVAELEKRSKAVARSYKRSLTWATTTLVTAALVASR